MLNRDTCSNKLKELLLKKDDQNTLEECNILMERVIECRHLRVMKRQKAKFEALVQWKQGGHSNKGLVGSLSSHKNKNRDREDITAEDTKKWVKNLSSIPLTADQERLLARGQSFPSGPGIHQSVNM